MKPIEQMTDEELLIEVAISCGYCFVKSEQSGGVEEWHDEDGEVVHELLNYPQDLNAMREAVKKFRYPDSQVKWKLNQIHLEDIVSKEGSISKDSVSFQWEVQNATARQRCIAFLKTIRGEK